MATKEKKTLSKKNLTHAIVSVVSVVENDAEYVAELLHDIDATLDKYENTELIIVDNGSTDTTVEVLRKEQKNKPYMRIIVLSRKNDIETAITAGMDHCIGDYVVTMNLHTDPPEMIDELITHLESGHDIVFAQYPREVHMKKNFLLSVILKLLSFVSKTNFFFYLNYLTACNRKVINAVNRVKRKQRSFSYIYSYIGFRRKVITYSPRPEPEKPVASLTAREVLARVFDMSISNSYRPLRMATVTGIIASLANVVFLIYVFVVTLVKKNIAEGWITTSVMIGAMFFLTFMILTIISEYLLRVLNESRDDPLYFIADEYDSSVFQAQKEKLNVV